MPFEIGAQVGPYRIEDKLGQGGMATVYKAYHERLERHVAIKALHPAITEDPTFIGRFEREARVVARLEHPNIVPVYDFAEHEGQPYLVMKYIQGETLKERLARGPVTPAEGLRIMDAVGSALTFAHEQGVLHRDVKPSNVILTDDGGVFLADFGLARIALAGESTISQDTLLGTPHYISPEQAKGMRDLGPQTDVYSFGVMLYELVVGRVPFTADTPFSIIHDHIYTPLPPPREVNPRVPEAIEQVLFKALAKEPGERYATAAELVAAFHRASGSKLRGAATEQHEYPVSTTASTMGAVAAPTVAAAAGDAFAGRDVPTYSPSGEASSSQASSATVARPARRLPWVWIVFGLVVAALLLGAGALAVWRFGQPAVPAEPTARPPTDQPVPTGAPNRGPDIPAIPPLNLPADLDAASARRVEEAYNILVDNPSNPANYVALADQYMRAGLVESALATFEQGAAVAGFSPEYYRDAALRADSQNHVLVALAVLEQGIVHNPDDQDLRLRAVALMFVAARLEGALPIFETYTADFPDWLAPQVAIARWYGFHNELGRAENIIRRLMEQHPDEPAVRYAYGELLFVSGDRAAAAEQLRTVIDDPATSVVLRRQAEQLLERIESGRVTPAGT